MHNNPLLNLKVIIENVDTYCIGIVVLETEKNMVRFRP